MRNSEHQPLIDRVMAWAEAQLEKHGRVEFTVFTLDERGRERTTTADPKCFASDGKRDRLALRMRKQFKKVGIIRYAIVAESWLTHVRLPGMPQISISPAGARQEVVFVHVCDRRGSSAHVAAIERHPLAGTVTGLRPLVTTDDMEALFAGRFVNLLEGQLH
jgi:hypothetical protein